MADSELTDLTAVTSLSGDELLYVVDDPSGTPLDRKVTVANLGTSIGGVAAFVEIIQDIVGAMASDGTTVNFTYNDSTGAITAEVQNLAAANISDFAETVRDTMALALTAGSNVTITPNDGADTITISATGGGEGSGLSDGDYQDVIVSGTGTVMEIDTDAVTYAKMQNVSATSRVLGRISSGAGDVEELTGANLRTIANVEDGATADMSAAEILAALVTVDGPGSGLDADTLDGLSSTDFVRDTGDETIAGVKTFSSDPIIPDEAYDATAWNGSLEPPTKNAVRDKIEDILDGVTFTGDVSVPDEAYDATNWNGSLEVPTKNAVRDMVVALPQAVAGDSTELDIDTVGSVSTFSFLRVPQIQYTRLTSNATAVNNSTVLVNVTGLSATLLANAHYWVDLYVIYRAATTADMKLGFSLPASTSGMVSPGGLGAGATTTDSTVKHNPQAFSSGVFASMGGAGASTDASCRMHGILVVGSTAGTLQVQYAQNSAEVSDVQIRTHSTLMVSRLV